MEHLNNEEEILGKAYDGRLMRRLLRYARPYWKQFALASLMLIAGTLTDLARPYLLKVAIDDYIANGNTKALGMLGMAFIGLILAGFAANFFQIYILTYTGQTIIYNIRQQVFSHLQRMSLSFFDHNPIGRLVTRVTNDTETLNDMYTNVLVTLLKDFLILIGSVVIMLGMDVKLALVSLAMLPVVLVVTAVFRIIIRSVYRDVRTTLARINSVLSENISGIRIIQIFNRERQNFQEFQQVNKKYYNAGMREIVTFGIFRPVVEMLAAFTIALILWYGGGEVMAGTIQFGLLYAFVNYVTQFFQPINDLAEKYNILQSSMAASERIFLILDTPNEEDKGKHMPEKGELFADIEFKKVWFAYKEGEWVLRDVSFKVPAGKTVAIVGATGAGKTSIINLLNRFYEIQEGEISIGGVNIRDISKDRLRNAIGMVLQDVFLFSGTVEENIRLNEDAIGSETIRQVSGYVNALPFIEGLPSGFKEEVKERGATFSSGQRQLLAFARALAFNPPILVLDEATANIDTETELLIQDALTKLSANRTAIIIAHRLSTIQHADSIIVLHKGKVREMGSHQELMEKKGMYYDLYQLQYRAG